MEAVTTRPPLRAEGEARESSTPRCAADLAVRHPKTLSADATIGVVREQLADDHVHLVLLTEGRRLVGTLAREDVLPTLEDSDPARPYARLDGRTVPPTRPASWVLDDLRDRQVRRVAVVSDDGTLVGLVCLNRRGSGVCSDEGIAARAAERRRAARLPAP